MYEVKTKALISCRVTAQLIFVFVFAYAKSSASHDSAQMISVMRNPALYPANDTCADQHMHPCSLK